MAVVRVPFCTMTELMPPFKLDENYENPNGIKSILLDKSDLRVVARQETVDVPIVGDVSMCMFYVVGTVKYICSVYPVVQCDDTYDMQQQTSRFTGQSGLTASDCVTTTCTDALGWMSASGSINIDEKIGASCRLDDAPSIACVTVDDFAVANNMMPLLAPTCPTSPCPCGEEQKRVVKWRGCIVITTTESL